MGLEQMRPVFGDLEATSTNDTNTRDTMYNKFGDLESHLNETLVNVSLDKDKAAELRSNHLHYRSSPASTGWASQKVLYEEFEKCSSEEDELLETKNQKEVGLKSAEQ